MFASRCLHMLVEVAKPLAFSLCILSLHGMFYTAFLNSAPDTAGRILDLLALAALAAAISFTSGLIFRDTSEGGDGNRLISTLPVQLFFWASSTMLVLFLVSWYLESRCVFYRDVRFYAGMS
jgi:cation transport ATPase